jgi:multidrug efflux pump
MMQAPTERVRFNLSQWALEHLPLTRYLMVVLMLLGVAAYFQLGQDEDPPFTFRAMVVRAYWPGASAQQMAELVADKIERTLQETPYADQIRSYSKPGETLVIFQLADSSPAREVQQIWYTTRKKIGDMRASLPQGVQGPLFNDEFGDVYGVIYALQGEGYSPAELKHEADRARQRLLAVKDVSKVEFFGVQDERMHVEISRRRLATLGLDLGQVLEQLGQQNAVASAGSVQGRDDMLQVRVGGQFNSIDELRAMPVRGGSGAQLRLGDIATITRGYVDPPQVKVHHNGQPGIALGISMRSGGDIIALGKALTLASAELRRTLPAGMQLVQVQDQPRAVTSSVNEFVKVLVEAVVVVLLVSFLSLGLHRNPAVRGWRRYSLDVRPGMVVFITIPLVLAMTFLVMHFWGIGLHKISLGSLIIALGLLVDDAIIAVEMMVRKLEEGHTLMRAATATWELTAMPMLTGTLITAAGFLPIGFAKSTVGEYTFAIFAVTAAALVLSWFVAVFFVPYLGIVLLKVKPHTEGPPTEVFDGPFYQRFRRLVDRCVAHRWLTLGATVLTFALGIAGMGKVQQQFFPDSVRPEILVDLWLPEGSSISANEAVTRRIEQRLAQERDVDSVTTWIGSGVPRFYLPLDQIFPQSNVSQLILVPRNAGAARARLLDELPPLLAAEFPEVRARVKLLPNGPPVPYPVQFRVVGPDAEVLRQRADEVKALMVASPNTRGVNDNWNEAIKVVRLEVDQAKARALGVSSASIAAAARTALTGTTIGQYREGDKLIDIVLRQPVAEREAVSELANAYVPGAQGKAIPLSQIARPVLAWEPGVLWREGRQYAITVQSDVVPGLQGATVTAELEPGIRALTARWAEQGQSDYHVQVAGAVAESSKGSSSIAAGMPMMLFITFTLLMLQLHSFSRSVLAFVTGFMGIAGVAGALLLLDRPFGFVALLGVIALFGMIVRNSVILIDQIEQDRALGVPAWTAIVEAAVRRLRPIVLTAAAAVLAMIPLSRSVFWGPMAVAIMGGLVVATVLTLLALPAMYAAWFRVTRPPLSA